MNMLAALSTSLVDIASVHPKLDRCNFPEQVIEQLANFILTSGGLINPLIVKRLNEEQFEIVEGELEYYAFVKASEINSDIEMVRAIIISPDQENVVKQQSSILRKSDTGSSSGTQPEIINLNSQLEIQLSNLKAQYSRNFEAFKAEQIASRKYLESEFAEVKCLITTSLIKLKLLDAFNSFDKPKLASKLNINNKVANSIIEERNAKGNFESLSNLLERVKGFGPKSLMKIIDNWD